MSDDRPLRPAPLFFSAHAVRRMLQRGFSERDVRLMLFTGTVAQSSWQSKQGLFRHARELPIRGKLARVIFTIHPHRYDIVTVEWVHEE